MRTILEEWKLIVSIIGLALFIAWLTVFKNSPISRTISHTVIVEHVTQSFQRPYSLERGTMLVVNINGKSIKIFPNNLENYSPGDHIKVTEKILESGFSEFYYDERAKQEH